MELMGYAHFEAKPMAGFNNTNLQLFEQAAKTLARVFVIAALSVGVVSADGVVGMQLMSSPGQPSIYDFLVNGSPLQLLCDDALHSIDNIPYTAMEDTLSDLGGTLLYRNGDPQALWDYEEIAMLDLRVLADPSLIRDVITAIWSITSGREARDPGAAAMIDWVTTQNPATYDLTGFRIFASPDHQEQIGFVDSSVGPSAPEPAPWQILGTGMVLLFLLRPHRLKLK